MVNTSTCSSHQAISSSRLSNARPSTPSESKNEVAIYSIYDNDKSTQFVTATLNFPSISIILFNLWCSILLIDNIIFRTLVTRKSARGEQTAACTAGREGEEDSYAGGSVGTGEWQECIWRPVLWLLARQ